LDLRRNRTRIGSSIRQLEAAGILISLFIDPDPIQISLASGLGVSMVELHTGRYAQARNRTESQRELLCLREAAQRARTGGLSVAAGHGLDLENVKPVAEIPEIEELNIGFSIVVRAMEVGFDQAVREMVTLLS
jgi:pyridoxine 5-phosphate synthase